MNKSLVLTGLDGEEKILISHIMDLAEKAERSGAVMYSPFLNPREYNLALRYCRGGFEIASFGGYEDAERKMIAFCPYDEEPFYPITALEITAKDGSVFSHRDYLGSLVALGIKRDKLGDIVIRDDCAIAFCHDSIADFICLNLDRVASGTVTCRECDVESVSVKREFEISNVSVASLRLDAVLSAAIGKSRDVSSELIGKGYVQLNYDVAKSTSAKVKSGDVISARGFGKMMIETDGDTTRKGRVKVTVKRFV